MRSHPAGRRAAPKSAAELIPSVFARKLDPHQTGFAFSEVLAHVNYMLRQGTLEPVATGDRIQRVGAASTDRGGLALDQGK